LEHLPLLGATLFGSKAPYAGKVPTVPLGPVVLVVQVEDLGEPVDHQPHLEVNAPSVG